MIIINILFGLLTIILILDLLQAIGGAIHKNCPDIQGMPKVITGYIAAAMCIAVILLSYIVGSGLFYYLGVK
jgi:hypothetical protein